MVSILGDSDIVPLLHPAERNLEVSEFFFPILNTVMSEALNQDTGALSTGMRMSKYLITTYPHLIKKCAPAYVSDVIDMIEYFNNYVHSHEIRENYDVCEVYDRCETLKQKWSE